MGAMKHERNTPKLRIPRPRILWPILLLLALFVLFFEFIADVGGGAIPTPAPAATTSPSATSEPSSDANYPATAQVMQVIDGATAVILVEEGTLRVSYYGVGAPERRERCFGSAREANKQLVEGQIVRLVPSPRGVDEDGRLLRYVFLEDGR